MIDDKTLARLGRLNVGTVLTEDDVSSLARALQFIAHKEVSVPPLIRVRCGRKDACISPYDVLKIHSTSGSSTFLMSNGDQWCTTTSLKSIEGLWGAYFVRLDRNMAINKSWIARVFSPTEGRFQLATVTGEQYQVSRRCYTRIKSDLIA